MPHSTSLIATIVVGLVLAFGFGFAARRLHLPPWVGYLLAGIAIGPFTPGFVADISLAGQLAEIGVILLMFGIGLHFSVKDLLEVYQIAVPGALAQIAASMAVCAAMAVLWGWGLVAGLLLGLSLSVASTVVLLRVLEERNALDTVDGRIAIGWLIVQDLAMVLVLVLHCAGRIVIRPVCPTRPPGRRRRHAGAYARQGRRLRRLHHSRCPITKPTRDSWAMRTSAISEMVSIRLKVSLHCSQ
jgi:predicted Kef-type K+ transport protein